MSSSFYRASVLHLAATPLLVRCLSRSESLEELLFVLALPGDDRAVLATYAAGCLVHRCDVF